MYLNSTMQNRGSFSKGNYTNEIKVGIIEYSFTDNEVYASPCSWMLPPRCPRASYEMGSVL